MQAHLLVGPIPASSVINGSDAAFPSSSSISGLSSLLRRYRSNRGDVKSHRKYTTVFASSSSSSWAAVNGEQDHYKVLGLTRSASAADIKRAYRLLARKHHPDVSKLSQASELFKSIHHAYEVLSNEETRTQYDRMLRFQEHSSRSYSRNRYYGPEVEDRVRIYRWAELRRKMEYERYWERYNMNDDNASSDSESKEMAEEGELGEERGPFSEVLSSAFFSLFLLHTLGSRVSLAFSSLMALFDRKLDAGYKIGYLVAWILGGRGGILLTLCLQFASWVCGKTSSSVVAVVVVAMWVGTNLARYAPIPQGALLTLLYMSIRLQR